MISQALIDKVRALDAAARRTLIESLPPRVREAVLYDWRVWARPEQLAPAGDWRTWLYLAGRGAGKSASGSGWVKSLVESNSARMIGLCAPTIADARDILIKGESGILRAFPPSQRPVYLPSKRRVEFANGAVGICLTAEEPDCPRGHNLDAVWCDELAVYPHGGDEIWSNLKLALRKGKRPRTYVSTTPKPTPLIKRLVDAAQKANSGVVITRGRTHDNRANLAPSFLADLEAEFKGTRLWLQEVEGEVLNDVLGALWKQDDIANDRVSVAPLLVRIVIGVDPAVSANKDSDLTGIVVCGIDEQGHGYVLEDASNIYTPEQWAKKVSSLFHKWHADRIVVEKNNGGDLVVSNMRTVDQWLPPIKAVHAAKGKFARAEPVASLAQQHRIHHVGVHKELEMELTEYSPITASKSPDRLDAMVYAITELMLGRTVHRDFAGYMG